MVFNIAIPKTVIITSSAWLTCNFYPRLISALLMVFLLIKYSAILRIKFYLITVRVRVRVNSSTNTKLTALTHKLFMQLTCQLRCFAKEQILFAYYCIVNLPY